MSLITCSLLLIAAAALVLPSQHGLASWYGEDYRGKPMANGRPFDPDALTCASWFFPLGTVVEVTHGNRAVIVTVTDRGPHRRLVAAGRLIDLSQRAFHELAPLQRGLAAVKIRAWKPP